MMKFFRRAIFLVVAGTLIVGGGAVALTPGQRAALMAFAFNIGQPVQGGAANNCLYVNGSGAQGKQGCGIVPVAPNGFAGLQRWYQGSSITPVSEYTAMGNTWTDSTGNANATQATAGSQPLYGHFVANGQPGIIITGTQNLGFTRETDFRTVFVVVRMADPQPNGFAGPLLGDTTSFDLASPANTSPWLLDVTAAPTAKQVSQTWVNGKYAGDVAMMVRPKGWAVVAVQVATGQTMAFSTISYDRVGSRAMVGAYAEIALYNTQLTAAQIQQVSLYLCNKYNIPFQGKAFNNAVNMIAIGDSMTIGQGATISYPTALATLLGSAHLATNNIGISGSTASPAIGSTSLIWDPLEFGNFVYNLGPSIGNKANMPTINFGAVNVCHFWLGTNDLFYSVTPATAYASLVNLWAEGRASGCDKIIAYTIVSRAGAGVPGGFNAARATLNGLIRGDPTQYDALVDLAANPIIGYDGAETNATYFQSDTTHMTNAGLQIVANMSQNAYNALGLHP